MALVKPRAFAGQNANVGMLPPSDSEDESEEEETAPTKAKQVLIDLRVRIGAWKQSSLLLVPV